MKSFFTPDRIWATSTLLHVYYLPDPNQLAPLLEVYEPILGAEPALAPVERQYLHATLIKIVRNVKEVDQGLLADRLCDRLLTHRPISLIAGPAVAGATGVVLDLIPDAEWHRLQTTVAGVVDDVLGADAVKIETNQRPHISLAYGIGDADSGLLQSRLRRVTDQRCHLNVDHLDLLEVTQDQIAHTYRWTPVSVLPLGPSETSARDVIRGISAP